MKKLSIILSVFLFGGLSSTQAQINLKEKLSKKANQEIDNLLFGKKKNKDNGSGSDSAQGETESSYEGEESYDDSDPLKGYQRTSVNYGSLSANKVVGFRDLINFLPDSFGSFQLSEKPDGSTMRFGESQYSTASKAYQSKSKGELKATIFDYMETGALLAGYANQYEYESTDGIMKSVEVKEQPGWYTADYDSGESSITLVVNQRFIISLHGDGLSEDEFSQYVETLDVDMLPAGPQLEEDDE